MSAGFFESQMNEALRIAKEDNYADRTLPKACGRILFAGVAADSGTSTIHLAVLAGLKNAGEKVQAFHAAASEQEAVLQSYVTGLPPRMLDSWLMDKKTLSYLLYKHSRDKRLATFECSGGLFDGLLPDESRNLGIKGASSVAGQELDTRSLIPEGSGAELALTQNFPVVLIMRPRGSRQSVLAEISGFINCFEEGKQGKFPKSEAKIRGIILNEVCERNYLELKKMIEPFTGLKVLGYLPPLPRFSLKLSRKTAGDRNDASWKQLKRAIDILSEKGRETLDFDAILELADGAPLLPAKMPRGHLLMQRECGDLGLVRMAVSMDKAFFSYNRDNLDLFAECGFELMPFSPLEDMSIPQETELIYLGGIFCPEWIPLLSSKKRMKNAVKSFVKDRSVPVIAETQGSVLLSDYFSDSDGMRWPMSGAVSFMSLAPRPEPFARSCGYPEIPRLASEDGVFGEKYGKGASDLDNPRGMSTWKIPYASLYGLSDSLLINAGERLRVLGRGEVTRLNRAEGYRISVSRTSPFSSGIGSPSVHLADASLLLYTRPELMLRLKKNIRKICER